MSTTDPPPGRRVATWAAVSGVEFPSPQLMVTAVGVSAPGSAYPPTVSVYVAVSATLPAPPSVTVGATLVTFTVKLVEADAPTESVSDTLTV